LVLRRLPFTTPWYVLRVRFGSKKSPETLVGGVSHQRLQAQTDGFRIRRRTTSGFGLIEQLLVNIEGLLHMYDYAILVQQMQLAIKR
jgi:hypothetical protein